jgi:hypothetical protein
MIRRWLTRLVAWVCADYFAQLTRRLEVLDARLVALQNAAGVSSAVPAPPAPRVWSCGHSHHSGVSYDDGLNECVDCHQEEFRR